MTLDEPRSQDIVKRVGEIQVAVDQRIACVVENSTIDLVKSIFGSMLVVR